MTMYSAMRSLPGVIVGRRSSSSSKGEHNEACPLGSRGSLRSWLQLDENEHNSNQRGIESMRICLPLKRIHLHRDDHSYSKVTCPCQAVPSANVNPLYGFA